MSDSTRGTLATSLSSLVLGLPLWLVMWRPMQAEAQGDSSSGSAPGLGDHARRSLIRKFYLYLVLFGSVIGGMATAVGLVYELIRVLLGSEMDSSFARDVLNFLQLLFLFGVVLIYHLNVLRMDGASTADALVEKQSGYSVLVVDSGHGFVESINAAFLKLGSKVRVTTTNPDVKPNGTFNAILLNGSSAVDAPEWIRSFNGSRILVQDESKDIVWADDAAQAVQSVQQLAEGQEIRRPKIGRSPLIILVYIFAGLFVLQLLFLLLVFGISLVMNAGF